MFYTTLHFAELGEDYNAFFGSAVSCITSRTSPVTGNLRTCGRANVYFADQKLADHRCGLVVILRTAKLRTVWACIKFVVCGL